MNSISTLKEDYTDGMSLDEGIAMAAKVLGKSMEVNKPDGKRFEIGVITRDTDGKVEQQKVEGARLDKIITDFKVFEELAK